MEDNGIYPGPVTRDFSGYRYVDPGINQVLVGIEEGDKLELMNKIIKCINKYRTNICNLGWLGGMSIASEMLEDWKSENIVCREENSMYVVEYTVDDQTVRGVLVEIDLYNSSCSSILPHENVNNEDVDKMEKSFFLRRADYEPILLVQSMTPMMRSLIKSVCYSHSVTEKVSEPGISYNVWSIKDSDIRSIFHGEIRKRQTFIADGHHRLASHLSLGHVLALVTDTEESPLQLGAIHRIISNISLDKIINTSKTFKFFDIYGNNINKYLLSCNKNEFIMGDGYKWKRVVLTTGNTINIAKIHEELDYFIENKKNKLLYRHEVKEAIKAAEQVNGVVILLPSPELSSIYEYISQGKLLPEKATSFWPKPPVSMVVRTY